MVGSNLNRYTYVLNNPLKYTDPSGYAYQGFGNSQINGVSTTLINSSSQISQQVQDIETRRKGFLSNLWGDVTLFDMIGRSGATANRQSYSSSSTYGFTPLYVNTPDAFVQNYYAFRAALFFANEEYKMDLQIRGSVLLREIVCNASFLNSNQCYSGSFIFGVTWLNYILGKETEFNVNVSALNFNHISQSDLDKDGYINLANPEKFGIYAFTGTALALGNIKLVSQGNNLFKIQSDHYDFDIKEEQGFSFRNIATAISGLIHGGVYNNFRLFPQYYPIYKPGYKISFTGSVYINP